VARADALAKDWAIALILTRPPQGIGEIPLERLAQDGPTLLAQAIRALGSDLELDRLIAAAPRSGRDQAGPARALAAMSGADDGATTVRAVEALRGVLWQSLLLEPHWQTRGSAAIRQLSDLSERLACVCASMLAVALERGAPSATAAVSSEAPVSIPGGRVARADPTSEAVIVDERVEPASTPSAAPSDERERPSSWDESPPRPPQSAPESALGWEQPPPAGPGRDEIAIRDARGDGRGEEGPAAWIGLIGRQLELAEADRRPFAVLLVEPREGEYLRAGAPHSEVLRLSEELEDALAIAFGARSHGEHRAHPFERGSLTCERPGRYWLLAPETDRLGASSLVERLARAVASVVEHRGQRLEVAIGTAVFPEDGRTAADLAAHADVSLYAARSAARAARGPRTAVRED
jgi:hypothetical protein